MGIEFVSHFPEWHHLLLKTKDADNSIRFYSEFLGMAAVVDQKDNDNCRWVWLRFSENPTAPFLVLKEENVQSKTESKPSGLPLMSFRMGDLKPVEEIGAKAKTEGCLVEGAHYGGHMRGYYCTLSDPDGNLLEFSYVLNPKPGQVS